jgi:hypothetical protein
VLARKNVLIVLALGVCIGIPPLLLRAISNEPRYEGRTLSKWLSMYVKDQHVLARDQQREKVDDAVRHIGTNAIPFLLRWYADDTQARVDRANAIYMSLPRTLRTNVTIRRFIYGDPKTRRSTCALLALAALDPNDLGSNEHFLRFINTTNTAEERNRVDRLLVIIANLRSRDTTNSRTYTPAK